MIDKMILRSSARGAADEVAEGIIEVFSYVSWAASDPAIAGDYGRIDNST